MKDYDNYIDGYETKADRRERRKQNRRKMKVSGAGLRTTQQVIDKKARDAKRAREKREAGSDSSS